MAAYSDKKDTKNPADSVSATEADRMHKLAESGNLFDIDSLKEALDRAFEGVISSEISELERISAFTECVREKMVRHYARIFPKHCNMCGTVYHTREEFMKVTHGMAITGTIFDEVGLQEYRNCPCGSTLILWTRDRRDSTEYGRSRRQLFNFCLEKMRRVSTDSEEDLIKNLRQIFSAIS